MQRHGPSCLNGPRSRRTERAFPSTSENGTGAASAKSPLSQAERLARIERIRLEIAAGEYDTPEKFSLALDKLLKRLGLD